MACTCAVKSVEHRRLVERRSRIQDGIGQTDDLFVPRSGFGLLTGFKQKITPPGVCIGQLQPDHRRFNGLVQVLIVASLFVPGDGFFIIAQLQMAIAKTQRNGEAVGVGNIGNEIGFDDLESSECRERACVDSWLVDACCQVCGCIDLKIDTDSLVAFEDAELLCAAGQRNCGRQTQILAGT